MKHAKLVVIVLAAGTLGACASVPGPARAYPTPSDWGALLTRTDSLTGAGRYAEADSVLVAFERAHPGTRAAAEVPFWRALYKIDPRNSGATRAEGHEMMEAYAAGSNSAWYRAHANVLRHLAREIAEAGQISDNTSIVASDTTIVAGDTSATGITARDRVIRNQRAEIARLNAELERIKRRLAAPTP